MSRKILIVVGFLLVLILLGGADILLTRGTLRFPVTDGGVAKQKGVDVEFIANAHRFIVAEATEQNMLPALLPAGSVFNTRVLLKEDDRAATIGWTDSPEVKVIFTALKKKLRSSFSPQLKDLIDETQSEEGKPPRDVLSFHDPALHSDRLLFVRIRERLYEFHITPGHEAEIDELVDSLTD